MSLKDWSLLEQRMTNDFSQSPTGILSYSLLLSGKKLRPRLVFLCAYLFNYQGKDHIGFGQALEYLHIGSLMHDDVIDHAQTRRGGPCAHQLWGTREAILGGDLLITKSMDLLMDIQNWEIMSLFCKAAQSLLQGQLQEVDIGPKTSLCHYVEMMSKKTAALFAAACKGGAMLGQASEAECQALYTYGLLLGISYQLLDDVADYQQPLDQWDSGHDFVERKVTYPLIMAWNDPTLPETSSLRDPFVLDFEDMKTQIAPYIDQTLRRASAYSQRAYDLLVSRWPESNDLQLFHRAFFPLPSNVEEIEPIYEELMA
jgi:octaprenyl-diphosphate synthase